MQLCYCLMVDGILNIKSIQSNFHVSHICNKGNKLPKCHTIAIKKKVTKMSHKQPKKKVTKMSHNCNQKELPKCLTIEKKKKLQG